MFQLVYRAIFRLVFGVVCVHSCWMFGKLRDLLLQIAVNIFEVI